MRKLVAIALAFVPLALHAEVGVRQASEADLAIALYDAAAASIPVAVGDDVYVSFVVVNNGPAVARDVHVRFVADPRWISPVGLFTCHDLDCSVGDLEPGQKADVRFHAKAPATPGTLTVEASVASSTDDRNPGNNVARAALAVVMWPELFIDSIKQDPQYQAEGRGSFDVRFGNKGTASATNVEVKIDFPEGSKVLSAVAGDGVNCDAVGETVTCRIPILPPSRDSVTIHTRFVNPPLYDGGTVQAEVQISGAEQEIYTANNTARTHWRIPQFFAVTNTADSGPGSLREAILAANAACRAPCTVGFRIPGPLPEAGFFTVQPSTPLPRALFVGSSDTTTEINGTTEGDILGVDATAPLVMIDGSRLVDGDGLQVEPGMRVRGVAIGHFPRFGIFVDGSTPTYAYNEIDDVYLGVDPTGHTAAPNLRGLVTNRGLLMSHCVISGNRRSGIAATGPWVDIAYSRIGVAGDSDAMLPNGASGIYLPEPSTDAYISENVIAWNHDAAIALSPVQHETNISANSIHDNGGGIDYGLDGPTTNVPDDSRRPPNYPLVDLARYDPVANKTVITVHIDSGVPPLVAPACDGLPNPTPPTQTHVLLAADLYANDEATGQAQRYLGRVYLLNGGRTGSLSVDGDLRGQSVSAVTIRRSENCFLDCCSGLDETSEISPATVVR